MGLRIFFALLVLIVNVLCACASAFAQGDPASKLSPDPWPRVVDLANAQVW